MAQHVDGDAAGEIDELATGLIPHPGTCTAHRNETGRRIVGNHYLVEIGTLHGGLLNGHRSLLSRNACRRNGQAMGNCKDWGTRNIAAMRQLVTAPNRHSTGVVANATYRDRKALAQGNHVTRLRPMPVLQLSVVPLGQPRSAGTEDNSNGLLLRRWLRSSRGVAPKKLR
jgi:hypothetical protein